MKRNELISYIAEHYGVEPEYPWSRWPEYAVFRHPENRKWFGVLMNVPSSTIGLEDRGRVDILNVKIDPDDASVLKSADFILPAYHMNKENWVSVLIEGGIEDEMLSCLLATSFILTSG